MGQAKPQRVKSPRKVSTPLAESPRKVSAPLAESPRKVSAPLTYRQTRAGHYTAWDEFDPAD
jgi:hypothetical protein